MIHQSCMYLKEIENSGPRNIIVAEKIIFHFFAKKSWVDSLPLPLPTTNFPFPPSVASLSERLRIIEEEEEEEPHGEGGGRGGGT